MIIVKGVASHVKGHRNFKDLSQFIQLHQTDYEPRTFENMKTNYGVSMDNKALLVHPITEIIEDNYDDFTHIEVGGVWRGLEGNDKTGNATVEYNGKTYHRALQVMTDPKEAALEECILHAVEAFRLHGIEPVIITHRQSFKSRVYDPGEAIARAGWRIAKKHGLKLDYQYVRPSGQKCLPEWCRE